MKIIIGADFVPTLSNEQLFIEGNIEELFGNELINKMASFDYRVFNLETPLSNDFDPIKKCGPHLVAREETINAIKKINVNLFTLANNHIFDHNVIGLNNTKKVLDSNYISYFGIGDNINEAKKPFIINDGEKKIGFYACVEHEFSIVNNDHSGANPFDVFETFKDIKRLKNECDYVIVLYHGGKEFYRYPSPLLRKRCKEMIEAGADLVITQHSHCIGSSEKYMNGEIIYGQGNFIFDHGDSEYWKASLLVSVNTDNRIIDYIPIIKVGEVVRLADETSSKKILLDFYNRSSEILKENFVEQNYKNYAVNNFVNYIVASKGKTYVGRIINKLTNGWYYRRIVKKFDSEKAIVLYDYLSCESHYELFVEGLKWKIGKK